MSCSPMVPGADEHPVLALDYYLVSFREGGSDEEGVINRGEHYRSVMISKPG